MKIKRETASSKLGQIDLYTITNAQGASVTLSSLGAGITRVIVPDTKGQLANVVLGYKDAADYYHDGPSAGKVPGRYANRIALGRFTLDGVEHQLRINNGPNHLHGGPEGFNNHLWQSEQLSESSVRFTLVSPDGDECYPGTLTATATYEWTDDCLLRLKLTATTDAPTVVNLTNHAYWNLAGEASGTALHHTMWLACSHYLPTSDSLIPTGEIAPVAGTPMDFTSEKEVGRDIKADFPALHYGKGYDNCWVVDGWKPGRKQLVARLTDAASGRVLEVSTDQPAAQVYTGNWLKGCPVSPSGHHYDDYDGVAIECQGMPDAPNHPNFPSQVLRPGERYERTIEFQLKTK